MPIINEKLFFFIHIPKTGGTSIEKLFDDNILFSKSKLDFMRTSPQHLDRSQLERMGFSEHNTKSFTVVRNPLERFESEYKYRFRASRFIKYFVNIDEFAIYALKYKNIFSNLDNHIKPQIDFIFPNTEIFRFEEGLEQVVEYIDELNLRQNKSVLPHLKKANNFNLCMNSYTVKLINEYYSGDLKAFGYQSIKSGLPVSILSHFRNHIIAGFFGVLLYLAGRGL